MTPPPAAPQRVWNAAVRVGHWTLAGSVLAALLLHEGGPWHVRLGWLALATAAWRVAYGLGTRDPHARFAAFVRGPRTTWRYTQALLAGREPHHTGHNPLGAWMILALLALALVAAGSGALYDTDAWWGDPVVYAIHRLAGWGLAVLAGLHLAGVVLTSVRQRENLVRAMVTGRKRN